MIFYIEGVINMDMLIIFENDSKKVEDMGMYDGDMDSIVINGIGCYEYFFFGMIC